jgi:NAD(P)-dependent dehydrogenase (short-subunit alcohol dehydrogenase family)
VILENGMNRERILQPDNVAVVTGAALGIGRALAIRLAEKGMSVVMADLQGEDFDNAVSAAQSVALNGPESVLSVVTDVSDVEQIEGLKKRTLDTFGKVDFLVNNAVTRIGRGFGAELAEWRQAIDVNFWGPIHGARAFLPCLLENPGPTAIVNVASKQGITNPPGHPIYNVSKSALKTYTEALQHELRNNPDNQGDSPLTAHLLVPGWTTTGKNEHKTGAWLPDQVVDLLLAGISEDRFYIICPDDEVTEEMDKKRILWAAQDITEDRPPLSRWHPDFAEVAKSECS